MNAPAPIALFAYARPVHLERTLAALRRNHLAKESELVIFCDGPREPRHRSATEAVRAIAEAECRTGAFRAVSLNLRPGNIGLARSIISGVTELCDRAGRAIVVEDDLVTSPWFLTFLNDGLDLYAENCDVASIHAYRYPGRRLPPTFFLRGADCWGWATWQRAWRKFRPDGAGLLNDIRHRHCEHAFDHSGARQMVRMLEDQIHGRNDSWAIRWHASAFLAGMVTLYPGTSLVQNIGNDASGTHCGVDESYLGELSPGRIPVERIQPVESHEAHREFGRFFEAQKDRASLLGRITRRMKRFLRK